MKKVLLASVALVALASPMSIGAVRADDLGNGDGFAALAVLMGAGLEAVEAKVRTDDKAFIDTCTEGAIAKWRGRDVSVNSLFEGQKLEDECVGEAVAMELGRLKAEEEAKEAREKAAADAEAQAAAARVAEAEAISERVAASHRPATGGVRVRGGRPPRVEYLANGSMQINY